MTTLSGTDRSTDMLATKGISPADIMRQTGNTRSAKTGKDFESMVLSQLLTPMFEGLQTDGMFGGGEGEAAFKSFYIDAMANQITKSGGVGIASAVQSELIRMQESQNR